MFGKSAALAVALGLAVASPAFADGVRQFRSSTFPKGPPRPVIFPANIYQAIGQPVYQPWLPNQPFPINHGRRFRPDCKALERNLEWAIRHHLGHLAKDVDVDIDLDDAEVDVEVDLRHRHPGVSHLVHQVVRSVPELRGFKIDIDIDD